MKKLGNNQNFVLLSSAVSGADETKTAVVGRRRGLWEGTWTFFTYREQTGRTLVTHSAVQINCLSSSVDRCTSSDRNKVNALVVLHLHFCFGCLWRGVAEVGV